MDLSRIILKPVITEKSMKLAQNNCYSFIVDTKANKNNIAQAVASYFKVDVLAVKTLKLSGKKRRFGKTRRVKILADLKKAIVKVKAGQKIDIFELENDKKTKKKKK